METHNHHNPFAIDIHLSSTVSVFSINAVIDAGPGRAIWCEAVKPPLCRTQVSSNWTDTSQSHHCPQRAYSLEIRLTGRLVNAELAFQLVFLQQNAAAPLLG